MSYLGRLLRGLAELPPVRELRAARYRRDFRESTDGWPRFYGLFDSRSEAEAAAPPTRRLGYDHPEVVNVSQDRMTTVWTSDYPVIYWLLRVMESTNVLFDLGGHVGTKYRAWRPLLPMPAGFVWRVCDLPSLVEAGRELAGDDPHLVFTSRHDDVDGSDVLLASGVLQYMDRDLAVVLGTSSSPPRHLLLNKVPTHDAPDVYTLENLLASTVPYRIFNRAGLLQALSDKGYELIDEWSVPESRVRVPFTSLGCPEHRGFYLRLRGRDA